MCGRFTLKAEVDQFAQDLAGIEVEYRPAARYNIAPTQPVATVLNQGRLAVVESRWGLIPAWASEPATVGNLINARAETLAEKPAFRNLLRQRRCLILADGFYEWKAPAGGRRKTPFYIRLKSRRPFAFAGLWDVWRGPDGRDRRSCTIVTTRPNEVVAALHDRMPAILTPARYRWWLSPAPETPADLAAGLAPYPAGEMEAYEVTTRVNRVAVDDAACVTPVAPDEDLFSRVRPSDQA
jgi:putative SOS response-associated peptidase YedK